MRYGLECGCGGQSGALCSSACVSWYVRVHIYRQDERQPWPVPQALLLSLGLNLWELPWLYSAFKINTLLGSVPMTITGIRPGLA